MHNLAIYIHWPFCRSKCPYCDFNSHVAGAIDHEAWREAYRREIGHYAQTLPGRRISSVFFGGGTPSLMESKTVEMILSEIARHWAVDDDVEITLEANPNSAEAEKFAAFATAGVNRLSLGVQSLRDEALEFLGRAHDSGQARRAIELAARHFPRFSFDLIYARAGQTIAAWETELREALVLAGGHISLYQLTIEPGTLFHTRTQRGERLAALDDSAAAMFEFTQDILSAAGLPAYEISNHAQPGAESRHNLTYWRYEDYIGIGPGAHGRIRRQGSGIRDQNFSSDPCPLSPAFCFATEDHRAPDLWLAKVKEHNHGLRVCEPVDRLTAQREALMMGLRLTGGIGHRAWQEKFGTALIAENGAFLPVEKIRRLEQEGYLANNAASLRATPAGLQRLNAVLGYLAA
jgi:putative oxygen-independent coproporphyrinogen III oxidase